VSPYDDHIFTVSYVSVIRMVLPLVVIRIYIHLMGCLIVSLLRGISMTIPSLPPVTIDHLLLLLSLIILRPLVGGTDTRGIHGIIPRHVTSHLPERGNLSCQLLPPGERRGTRSSPSHNRHHHHHLLDLLVRLKLFMSIYCRSE
jgi:hypothetical protein